MGKKTSNLSASKLARREVDRRADDFGRVGLQPESSSLPNNDAVFVERDERASTADKVRGNVERARRMDALDALRDGMAPGAYDAARRLERDITIRRGEHDHGRPVERVDGDIESAYGRNDAIIAAGERVDAVLERIGEVSAKLLSELVSPSVEIRARAASWRDIVHLVTGETHTHGQASAVRTACHNLARAYEKLDIESRRKAA